MKDSDQSVPDRFFIYSRRRGRNQIVDRFGGTTISVHARKRDAERECRTLNWALKRIGEAR